MIKSMYGSDYKGVRKQQQFRAILGRLKREVSVNREETTFRGNGTNWKGSYSDVNK